MTDDVEESCSSCCSNSTSTSPIGGDYAFVFAFPPDERTKLRTCTILQWRRNMATPADADACCSSSSPVTGVIDDSKSVRYKRKLTSVVSTIDDLTAASDCELIGRQQQQQQQKNRNKLNLTIGPADPPAEKRPHFYTFTHPVYQILMQSPVAKKLREYGFAYPEVEQNGQEEEEEEEETNRRRRLLHFAVVLLILLVLLIIALNALLPYYLPRGRGSSVGSSDELEQLQFSLMSLAERNGRREKSEGNALIEVRLITAAPNAEVKSSSRSEQLNNRLDEWDDIRLSQGIKFERKSEGNSRYSKGKIVTAGTTTTTTVTTPMMTAPKFDQTVQCGKNQFQCPIGAKSRLPCLYLWERCDGIVDCSDGYDESFCEQLRCFGNFECRRQEQCVSLVKVCNGILDCDDGTDEDVCDTWSCHDYEFRCSTGYCIPMEFVCDGGIDCPNHEDEFNCSSSCSDDEFLCPEGVCISKRHKCDGQWDCVDGSDEKPAECQRMCDLSRNFECATGGDCVPTNLICDGQPNCPDASDEWRCLTLENSSLIGVNEKGIVALKSAELQYTAICYDGNWPVSLGEEMCRSLGFKRLFAIQPALVDQFRFRSVFLVNTSANQDVGQWMRTKRLIPTGSCNSNQVAELTCTLPDCGRWEDKKRHRRRKRIVGNQMTEPSKWPNLGVLYHAEKKWACTATFLSGNFVATSSLCVKRTDGLRPSNWELLVSATNRSDVSDLLPFDSNGDEQNYRRLAVLELISHPLYKFRTQISDYDVMLVRFLDKSDNVRLKIAGNQLYYQSICLPNNGHSTVNAHSRCTTAGWGYSSPGGYELKKQLKQLEMSVVDVKECNSTAHYNGIITSRMICAKSRVNANWTPCFNDEGAPLMCLDELRRSWVLRGVLTRHSCGTRNHPAVFADVNQSLDWINYILLTAEHRT